MSGGYDYTYRKRYNHDRAQGITRTTPADPIRAHIQNLRNHGWSWHDIGRAAGIGLTTAHTITTSGRPRVRTVTANRILAIRPEASEAKGFVPAAGTRAPHHRTPRPLAYDDETLDDPSPRIDAIARRNATETAA